MSTPGKTGTVFPAARIVANPFAAGIVVDSDAAASSHTPGIKWNEPQSLGLDQLDENALSCQLPSAVVTPGKSILKTPGAKTPGSRLRANNHSSNNNGALGTPVRTPGKTPGGVSTFRSLALSKTPGEARRHPTPPPFPPLPFT